MPPPPSPRTRLQWVSGQQLIALPTRTWSKNNDVPYFVRREGQEIPFKFTIAVTSSIIAVRCIIPEGLSPIISVYTIQFILPIFFSNYSSKCGMLYLFIQIGHWDFRIWKQKQTNNDKQTCSRRLTVEEFYSSLKKNPTGTHSNF